MAPRPLRCASPMTSRIKVCLTLGVVLGEMVARHLLHLFGRGDFGIDAEVSHQALPGQRLKLRLDLGPDVVAAADQQAVAAAALEVLLDVLGDAA